VDGERDVKKGREEQRSSEESQDEMKDVDSASSCYMTERRVVVPSPYINEI